MRIQLVIGCTNDKGVTPSPMPEEIHTLKFVFVSRNGFRNDSVGDCVINTVLKGVCLESKYYNSRTNMSQIGSTCYNRNFASNNFPLSDSIMHREYPVYVGSHYALEVEMVWKQNVFPYAIKGFKYATENWPNAESIYTFQDTIIKFVRPDDTMPGSRFHKTYQYP